MDDAERKENSAQTDRKKREIVDIDMSLHDVAVIDLTFLTGDGEKRDER